MENSLSFLHVYGHTSPITYEPSPNQIIDSIKSVPDKMTISFTEGLELRASSIKVIKFPSIFIVIKILFQCN